MSADELRTMIHDMLREEWGGDVWLQGKRIVVDDDGDKFVILVTAAKLDNERVSLGEKPTP